MNDKKYNGWSNCETWVVKLWIDNDEGSQSYWQERAQEAYSEAGEGLSAYAKFTGKEIFTREEKAALALMDELKESHEEALPELQGFAADLLNAAMSEVNWNEIAASLIEATVENESAEQATT